MERVTWPALPARGQVPPEMSERILERFDRDGDSKLGPAVQSLAAATRNEE